MKNTEKDRWNIFLEEYKILCEKYGIIVVAIYCGCGEDLTLITLEDSTFETYEDYMNELKG